MKITSKHIAMFNAGKHPSANDSVNALTGCTRDIYLKLRDIRERVSGHVGKISMRDLRG